MNILFIAITVGAWHFISLGTLEASVLTPEWRGVTCGLPYQEKWASGAREDTQAKKCRWLEAGSLGEYTKGTRMWEGPDSAASITPGPETCSLPLLPTPQFLPNLQSPDPAFPPPHWRSLPHHLPALHVHNEMSAEAFRGPFVISTKLCPRGTQAHTLESKLAPMAGLALRAV